MRLLLQRMHGITQAASACHHTQAVVQARKGLLVRGQDVACIIASTPQQQAASAAVGSDDQPSASVASGRPLLRHRLVVLECEPRSPAALLVKTTLGVTDRAAAPPA